MTKDWLWYRPDPLGKFNIFHRCFILNLLYNFAETTEGTEGNQEELRDAKEEAIDEDKADFRSWFRTVLKDIF